MTANTVNQIWPSAKPITYPGVYLNEFDLSDSKPVVFSNFITSLDGKIAMHDGANMTVPKLTANNRDWRLFNELAAQADILVTSGRYIRDLMNDNAQDILPMIDRPGLDDLINWRLDKGLKRNPDLAILSRQPFNTLPKTITAQRTVLQYNTKNDAFVDTRHVLSDLINKGYKRIYLVTGGILFNSFLANDLVDILYLTFVPRILGGETFTTFCEGAAFLEHAKDFELSHIIHDAETPGSGGQFFHKYTKL